MTWVILLIAGLFEIGMVMGLNYSEGFTRLVPSLLAIGSGATSFYLLSVAMQGIPVGIAYAVWTSVGVVGAVTLGMVVLNEPSSALKIIGIATVVGGVIMLRVAEGG